MQCHDLTIHDRCRIRRLCLNDQEYYESIVIIAINNCDSRGDQRMYELVAHRIADGGAKCNASGQRNGNARNPGTAELYDPAAR